MILKKNKRKKKLFLALEQERNISKNIERNISLNISNIVIHLMLIGNKKS